MTAAQPARVSFVLPADADLPRPDLPGALEWQRGAHGSTVVTTSDLQATLAALLRWADSQGVTLAGLHASPATLEDAFLTVAGTAASDTSDTSTGEAA